MQLPLVIIGAGSIGMRHVEVAQTCPDTCISAVVEPFGPRRAELRQMGLNAVETLDAVPPKTRAAVIATPTPDHHLSTMACLDRGWPVLVEKPVTATLDQANQVVESAAARGLPLITGHHRRCHPFSRATRAALGEIGELVGVQGLWSLRKHDSYYDAEWRRQPGAGPLMTNLSHELDLLRFFLGDIEEISALTSNARRGLVIEDTAAMALRFAGGALGSFLISDAGASPWSFEGASGENPAIAASHQDYLRFVGTEGALEFPSLTNWGRSGPGEIEWSRPLRRTDAPAFEKIDPLLDQLARFTDLVNGGGDDVLCTGEDGARALEMTLAAALSAKQGRPVRAGEVPGHYTGV
ncbi:Gfo/Idh/MocA family oxidoreductase [Primorskyibacter aestuariivivens]|uniref:Gfo/Idh/MocA family protein n=1 Tax=Primorskyibacter aestuariivivens TaxID=1888912 RepID=UPI002301E67D|nr:Gfo/Idh/MocA family oxidoreductase [Primorskyibacter aestuariivivens]MDA7429542.1 Gfo/Idh/MocA family oxidoreductase [Primorskyibacter aestuariivivens]